LGYFAAALEALFGVVLLFLGDVKWIYLFGASLHLLILTTIAPRFLGIFGWNVFCFAFHANRFLFEFEFINDWFEWWNVVVVILFFVLPLCNVMFGFGERLSFKLHSQNNHRFLFLVPKHQNVPKSLLPYLKSLPDGFVSKNFDANWFLSFDFVTFAVDDAYLMPPLSVRTASSIARHISKELNLPCVAVSRN
jgi:hypothetical protein